MVTFKDAADRQWELDVNIVSVKKVRDETDVDLLGVTDGKLHAAITDPQKLVAVLYSLCEEQATKTGITPDQFGRSLRGDAIEGATYALLDAITEFFPRAQREVLQAMNAKAKEMSLASSAELLKRIEGITPAAFLGQTTVISEALATATANAEKRAAAESID